MPFKKISNSLFLLLPFLFLFLLTLFSPPPFSYWTWYSPSSSSASIPPSLLKYQFPPEPETSSVLPPLVSPDTLSFLVLDPSTNSILLGKNIHRRLYPASTTKIVTAATALNLYSLGETITSTQSWDEGKVLGIEPNQSFTTASLVQAMLVYSANDAALLLAAHHPQGPAVFVSQMNKLARYYSLNDSHFVNVNGLHAGNHFSSAYDLAQFARLSLRSPVIRASISQSTVSIEDLAHQPYELENTNELLEVLPEVKGVKTGWTPEAGECFVGLLDLNGHELITVVLGSKDRFSDTKELIAWAKKAISWQTYTPY